MASLTPLSKGLIGLAVVGAMASAVWNLALKERFGTPSQPAPASTAAAPDVAPATQPVAPAVTPPAVQAPQTPPAAARADAPGRSAAENAEIGRKLLASGDFAQARVHLEQAVKDGDGSAACHLGDMTLKGQGGISASQEEATRLFQLAQSRNIICFASGK
jgi:TPR repeat protein